MPQQLDACVQALIDKGYTESQAWAICKAQDAQKPSEGYTDPPKPKTAPKRPRIKPGGPKTLRDM
jgi:hypothetical protein